MDFYKPFAKPNQSSKHYIKVGRISTIAFVILAALSTRFVADFGEGLYKFIQVWWGCIQPGIVAAFFLGFAYKRTSAIAAVVGMVINVPMYLFLLYQFPDIAFLHHMAICFVVIIVIMLVISKFKPETREIVYPVNEGYDMKPSKTVLVWSIMIFVATVALYWIFR